MKLKVKWPLPQIKKEDLKAIFLKSSISKNYFFPPQVPSLGENPSFEKSLDLKEKNESQLEKS